MRTSDQTNEIAAALSLAQGELDPAPKDSVNPHFKSHYADLASCRRVSQPVLAKHGLAVIQVPLCDFERGFVGVCTRLTHKSGQFYEGDTWCKPKSQAPQDVGGGLTYLRRYGYCAIIGLVADADDDGNSAQGAFTKRNYSGNDADKAWLKGLMITANIPQTSWQKFADAFVGKEMTGISFEQAVARFTHGD